jgi:hypothetical protein
MSAFRHRLDGRQQCVYVCGCVGVWVCDVNQLHWQRIGSYAQVCVFVCVCVCARARVT